MPTNNRLINTWVLVILMLIGLAACNSQNENGLPTVASTALPTPTLAAEQIASPTLPPPVTMEPTVAACEFPTQPALTGAWSSEELGCPTTAGAAAINTAYAPFEGGQMLWRGDTDTIYVLYNDGRWESYPNEWEQSSQEFSCGEESSPPTPKRGFGRVWCDHPAVRDALGAVTADEIGDAASAVQDFANGTILVAPFGDLFVFAGESGTWRVVEAP